MITWKLVCSIFLLTCIIADTQPATTYPRQIHQSEFLDYYINGAALAYATDIQHCQTYFSNITEYSFRTDIRSGYLTYHVARNQWILTDGEDREVEGKHLNLSGPAIRYTSIALDDSNPAIIGMNDFDPQTGKQLAMTEFYCADGDGLFLYAVSPKGVPVGSLKDLKAAIEDGDTIFYSFDIYHCSPELNTTDQQFFAGHAEDLRLNKHGDIEFSNRLLGLGFVTPFSARVSHSGTDVTVTLKEYSRQTFHYTQTTVKTCTLGKSFKIYKQPQMSF